MSEDEMEIYEDMFEEIIKLITKNIEADSLGLYYSALTLSIAIDKIIDTLSSSVQENSPDDSKESDSDYVDEMRKRLHSFIKILADSCHEDSEDASIKKRTKEILEYMNG